MPKSVKSLLARDLIAQRLDWLLDDVKREVLRATDTWPPINNPHEGYAVILEELDELWDEVKKKNGGRSLLARKEAVQVAAMAIRYILDLDPKSDEAQLAFTTTTEAGYPVYPTLELK